MTQETSETTEIQNHEISEATLALVAAHGVEDENHTIYLKLTDKGFAGEGFDAEKILGQIVAMDPHWIRWPKGADLPEKSYTADAPDDDEDWMLRCDITIRAKDNIMLALSLAPTSYARLRRYMRLLKADGLRLQGVITEMWVSKKDGKHGQYLVVEFASRSEIQVEDEIPF